MFDLFRSRDKAVRYLLGGLLLLVAISMVVTLVPGFGSGRMGGRDETVVAKIGDDEVTVQELRTAIQDKIKSRAFPPEMAQFYVPVMVQSMIADRAAVYEAKRVGFRISNQELADNIVAQIPQLVEGGKFVGNEAYASYLATINMTIPQFEDAFRKQMLYTRLENMVLEGVIVTPAEVEDAYRKRIEKIAIAYVVLDSDKYKGQVSVTPAELQDFYGKTRANYMKPEARNLVLFSVEGQKLAGQVKPDDATLKTMYDAQRDRFRVDERVKVRHILVMAQDKSKEETEKLKKKAEDLLKQVKAGADFGELAKKNSDDPGSKEKGGDLGFVVKGQTVAEFEKTAFAMKPGEVSNIVQTTYGFHILKCEGHENARIRSFDEVKDQLAAEVTQEKAADLVQKAAEDIRSALIKSVAEAEKTAQKYGIDPVRVEKAGKGDPIPEVGVNADFEDAAYRLPKDGVTSVVTVGPKLVVARVTGITPPRPAEFADVEGQLRGVLLADKARKLAQDKAKELQDKLKASNGDLAAAAKQLGLEVKTAPAFAREGSIPGIGQAMMIAEAFPKAAGETGGPIQIQNGVAFYKVTEKIPADMSGLAAQRDQIVQGLKARKAGERKELFGDGLVNYLVKDKKLKINEDAVKRFASAYRSS